MAVVSISRIQHRRGVRLDLPPNLNEAELGWCIDTRQLFIGNGNTYTGNSEILTQWSPNDQIITHVYVGGSPVRANTAITGSPTVRTLGSILDDYLDVRDYGAKGDGITDDTAAIQAAISDEWARVAGLPYSPYLSRNTIYFPAGNYLVSSSIRLYPYTTLAGEGVNRSQITLIPGATGPLLRTADSLGQTDGNIGTNGAVLPTSITVRGFNLDASSQSSDPVVLLQRCSGVTIAASKVVNGWTQGSGPLAGPDGIAIQSLGTVTETSDIYITGASIRNCAAAITMEDPIKRVYVADCNIYNSYTGLRAMSGVDGVPDLVWAKGNSFRNLDGYGIEADTYGTISSMGNSFEYIDLAGIWWSYQCASCQSIGDVFNSPVQANRIQNGNPGYNLIFDLQHTELITNEPSPLQVDIYPGSIGSPTGISYDLGEVTTAFTAFIDYTVCLDSYRKAGRLMIVSDGVTASLTDTGTELNNAASVTFSASVWVGMLSVDYTSTGTTTGTLSYIQTFWSN